MHFKNILLLLILSCIVIRWIGVIFLFVVVLLVLKTGPYKKDKNRVNVEGKWEYIYEFVKGYTNNLIELSYCSLANGKIKNANLIPGQGDGTPGILSQNCEYGNEMIIKGLETRLKELDDLK